ncbi:ABC transporter substrate-binding protein [Lysinimonas soli]|uniref:ABC transporter substrate-binding protein n=1 Tax=Lysinimonas soli TaxID=1074233 RepID=A0ABW0NRJ3_9MICO
MATKRHFLGAAAAGAAALLILTGCSTGGGSTPSTTAATGTPIDVAALSSLSFFPEAPQAAQAVFDDYNAAGGYQGHPIAYKVYDDKADPSASATAAQNAISSKAVALVGSSSLLDCQINHTTWESNKIVSIQGSGVDPYCFTTPNISPTNAGPYFDAFAALDYGSETLGLKNICAVYTPDSPAIKAAFEQSFAAWSTATGKRLSFTDDTLTRGQASYAANVSTLKSKKCDAIFEGDTGDSVLKYLGEAANQGLTLPVLALTSSFSDQFAQAYSYPGNLYVPAEFAPYYDDKVSGNSDWAKVMDAHKVPKTSFAQGGYLAAKYFIDVLESIKGDVTRDSFTAAAKGMTKAISSPMAQADWIFGSADHHQSNNTAYVVELKAGTTTWTSVGPLLTGSKLGWSDTTVPSAG